MNIFHAHIYFSENEIELAENVRATIAKTLPQLTYVGNLIPKPIGPHTKPMFEVHIPAAEVDAVTTAIDQLRQGLSVLIHPVQANELEAHTNAAKWLGQKLPLHLNALDLTSR